MVFILKLKLNYSNYHYIITSKMSCLELEEKVSRMEAIIAMQDEIIKKTNVVLNTDELNKIAFDNNIQEYIKILRLQETVYKLVGKIIFEMGSSILKQTDHPIAILMFRKIHNDLMICRANEYDSITKIEYIINLQEIVYWLIKITFERIGKFDQIIRHIDYMFMGLNIRQHFDHFPTISEKIKWLQGTVSRVIEGMFCPISEKRVVCRLINYMYYGLHYEDNLYVTRE